MNGINAASQPLAIQKTFRNKGSIGTALLPFAVLGLCFLTFGLCPAEAQNRQPGETTQTIKVSGVDRSFIRYIPKGYDASKPVAIVFVFHGRGGNAKGIEKGTGFSKLADTEGFIAIYPSGLGTPSVWNSGIDPTHTEDDTGFFTAMLDRLEKNFKIDPKRVFVCGFSAGAMMSYRLGGQFSDRIAAIGVASGSAGVHLPGGTTWTDPVPSRPISAIVFHGKMDTHVKYNGGSLHADTLSVADSIAFWTKADGCRKSPTETTQQNGNLVIDDYTNCRAGSEIILRSFGTGTHEWPSLTNNDNFDATEVVWKFFVQHPLP
ncbi:MAG: PHB depolymerase family esterase [Acidobacteriota bacterium]